MTGITEEDAVRRIAELEARNPKVMIWNPDTSASGNWEAMGEWLIEQKSAATFCALLASRLDHPPDDPRAYHAAGLPVACGIDGEGSVWLAVGGELVRLEPVAAMRLGGNLGGAAKRALGHPGPPPPPPEGDRLPPGTYAAYLAVADRLAERIKAGEFNGRRLPTGPELMAHYGVNRAVMTRARRELISRGLVTVTQGIGTFAV